MIAYSILTKSQRHLVLNGYWIYTRKEKGRSSILKKGRMQYATIKESCFQKLKDLKMLKNISGGFL